MAWSPDRKRLATTTLNKNAVAWYEDKARASLTLRSYYRELAWSPDGKWLATAEADHTAKVWDVERGRELTVRGHNGFVNSVVWSPDGKRLATGSDDHIANVRDVTSGQQLLSLRGHDWEVLSAAWSPDGKRLAVGQDDTVQIYAMDIRDLLKRARSRITRDPLLLPLPSANATFSPALALLCLVDGFVENAGEYFLRQRLQ